MIRLIPWLFQSDKLDISILFCVLFDRISCPSANARAKNHPERSACDGMHTSAGVVMISPPAAGAAKTPLHVK